MKTLHLTVVLFKNWIRSRMGVFFSFLFPVVLLLIFGSVFGGGAGRYSIWVQNRDLENGSPSDLSIAFISAMENSGVFSIKMIPPSVEISSWVKEHIPSFTSYRVLVIPENFGKKAAEKGIKVRGMIILSSLDLIVETYGEYMDENNLRSIQEGKSALENWVTGITPEEATLILYVQEGDASAQVVSSAVQSIVQAFNNSLISAQSVIEVKFTTLSERTLKPADYYVPGYTAAFIMTNGVIGLTSNISEFRRNGILKRVAATPLSKKSWILANLITQVILAFLLTIIMIFLGRLIFGTSGTPDIFFICLVLLGATLFCAIGITMGGLIKDVEAASAAGNLVAFPMMFLSGAFWPIEIMPEILQTIAKCMPLYYFHQGLRQTLILGNPAGALTSFVVLGALSVVFVLLAVKITKWKEI
ncbi:MAG: ABC transporter permease [Candidatus Hadarchaeales archaeon]